MNKKILSILLGLFLITSFLLSSEGIMQAKNENIQQPMIYVTYVDGAAYFEDYVGEKIVNNRVEVDVIIQEGDMMFTQKGRVEVYLGNGNFLRLDEETQVIFDTLQGNLVILRIGCGNIHLQIDNAQDIRIETKHHELFDFIQGRHLLETGQHKTKHFKNPRLWDNGFTRWFYERQRMATNSYVRYRPLPTELVYYRSYQRYLPLYGLYFGPYYYPGFSSIWWIYYRYYPYYHRNYHRNYFRRHYHQPPVYQGRATIHRNQLSKNAARSNRAKETISKEQIKRKNTQSRVKKSSTNERKTTNTKTRKKVTKTQSKSSNTKTRTKATVSKKSSSSSRKATSNRRSSSSRSKSTKKRVKKK